MGSNQKTYHGAYSRDDLGTHGGAPLKVTEMDPRRTKCFTVDDAISFADVVDRNSNENSNFGMTTSVKRKR